MPRDTILSSDCRIVEVRDVAEIVGMFPSTELSGEQQLPMTSTGTFVSQWIFP